MWGAALQCREEGERVEQRLELARPAPFYKPPRNEPEDSEPRFCLWQKLRTLSLVYALPFLGTRTDDVL